MNDHLLRLCVSLVFSVLLATRSYKSRSLDKSGAIAGFIVVALHIAVGWRFGALILAFFFTSSKLTKVGEEKKRSIDDDFKAGGQRNWVQVLVNSELASFLALTVGTLTGFQDKCLNSKEYPLVTGLIGGIIGHYSCCNGDTWSSEVGMLSNEAPRLITTFKESSPISDQLTLAPHEQELVSSAPHRASSKGTNGGVTSAGLLAAMAAGGVIGLTFVLVGMLTAKCVTSVLLRQLWVIPLSVIAGLCGSLIDSLLGATLQFSGYCIVRRKVVGKPSPTVRKISGLNILDNNGVNLVSVTLTAFFTAVACLYIF